MKSNKKPEAKHTMNDMKNERNTMDVKCRKSSKKTKENSDTAVVVAATAAVLQYQIVFSFFCKRVRFFSPKLAGCCRWKNFDFPLKLNTYTDIVFFVCHKKIPT